MYSILKPLLFLKDPEEVHEQVLNLLEFLQEDPMVRGLAKRFFRDADPRLKQNLMGLRFDNPVGLAAGFDKDGRIPRMLACLGFGHVEVGAITAQPQSGNPRPRLFRIPEDEALINRMGFNNEGADAVSKRLRTRDIGVPLGVNLGKSKAADDPVQDYLYSFRTLYDQGDYFVINVSSPNTPGLRELQEREALMEILTALRDENKSNKPLLVKVSPDLGSGALRDVAEVIRDLELDGVIAVNTSLSRGGLSSNREVTEEPGGLSGKPLQKIANNTIAQLYRKLGGEVPIIGVGGVFTAKDAYRKIRAGASLVQLYTGFVYRGPSVTRNINRGLLNLLERDGLSDLGEAVGTEVPGGSRNGSPV